MRLQLFVALALLTLVTHAQQTTLPLWPNGAPEHYSGGPETNSTKPTDSSPGGKPVVRLTNIGTPTLAFYPASANNNTGATVVVFPGGSYRILAYDLEGTEVCTWLHSIGVNCALVKYRVPIEEQKKFRGDTRDLEDALQAMRITRSHAAEWHFDPHRIGALGFSAGGHLVIVLGNHTDFKRPDESASETAVDARPDFIVAIYPAYLAETPALTQLAKGIDPNKDTPPTFLLQAEDDPVHVENVLLYAEALKQLKVPTELHVYSQGGHGYGLRPTSLPVTHWPALVEMWLRTITVLPASGTNP